MKKVIFGLIATVMFLNLSLGQNNENFIKPEMYGTYHNELLEIYSKKDIRTETINFFNLYDNLKKEFDVLHPNVISNEEYLFYKNRLVSVLGENGNLNSTNFVEITIKGIKKYYTNEKTQLALISFIETPKAPSEVNIILQNLLNDKELNNSEINEVKKLVSVFNASIKYWNVPMNDNSSTVEMKCNPKHQVYLADIAGCMFGGLGSIAYSWLVDEMQQQHGGGCI